MPDTVILADQTLDALHSSFHSGVERIVMQTFELQRQVSREYEIRSSPLEKFLNHGVIVEDAIRARCGVLTDFGGGWVQIEEDGRPVVIFTGAGTSIRPDPTERQK